MKKYIITICIVIILAILCVSGYIMYKNENTKTTPEEIKAKVNQEIKYLDSNIISMLNDFNNISYANYKITQTKVSESSKKSEQSSSTESSSGSKGGEESQSSSQGSSGSTQNETIENTSVVPNSVLTNKNKDVNWDALKEKTELMYSTWPTTLIDLTSLNVNGSQLLQYTSILDKLTKSLEDKNKKEAMLNLSDLYNLLNEYLKQYSQDSRMKNIFQTKAFIAQAYALAEEDNWNEMKQNIAKAKTEYMNIVNNIQNTNSMSNVNKAYVLLNELEKNTMDKNKKIFYINYKNVMQELETIA